MILVTPIKRTHGKERYSDYHTYSDGNNFQLMVALSDQVIHNQIDFIQIKPFANTLFVNT